MFFWQGEMAANNGEFSFSTAGKGRNGLPKIQTQKTKEDEICHDDSHQPVKAKTLDELHSLQKKKSAPTTPLTDAQTAFGAAVVSEEERHKQQLQSIR